MQPSAPVGGLLACSLLCPFMSCAFDRCGGGSVACAALRASGPVRVACAAGWDGAWGIPGGWRPRRDHGRRCGPGRRRAALGAGDARRCASRQPSPRTDRHTQRLLPRSVVRKPELHATGSIITLACLPQGYGVMVQCRPRRADASLTWLRSLKQQLYLTLVMPQQVSHWHPQFHWYVCTAWRVPDGSSTTS